jgi:hypothetical protein
MAVSGLGGGLQQYVEPDYDLELRQRYKKTAETLSRTAMAQALAAAFRASDSGFPGLFGRLFEHSNDELRAKIFVILIPSLAPAAQTALWTAGLFAGSPSGPDVPIERMSHVSIEAARLIAAEAEECDPAVVERVCNVYSQFPNITKYLPTDTLAAVLAYVARRRC